MENDNIANLMIKEWKRSIKEIMQLRVQNGELESEVIGLRTDKKHLQRDVKTQMALAEKGRNLSNSLTVKVDDLKKEILDLKKENKILDSQIKGDFFPVAQPSLCDSCGLNEGNSVNVKCPQPAHALCGITIVEECDGYKPSQAMDKEIMEEKSWKDEPKSKQRPSLCDSCKIKPNETIHGDCHHPDLASHPDGMVYDCPGYTDGNAMLIVKGSNDEPNKEQSLCGSCERVDEHNPHAVCANPGRVFGPVEIKACSSYKEKQCKH